MIALTRVSVRTRQLWLAALGALTVCLCVLVAIAVTRELTRSSQKAFIAKDVVADILPPPMYLIEMRLVLSRALETSIPVDQGLSEMKRLRREYEERVAWWTAHPPFGLEAELLGAQHREAQAFMTEAEALFRHLREGDHEAATAALLRAEVRYLRHRQGVDATVKAATSLASQTMLDFEERTGHATGILLGLGLLSLALLLALAWAISQSLVRPLREAVTVAEAVAAGDLTHQPPVNGSDEPAMLLVALNTMSTRLAGTVERVRLASLKVGAASTQIAAGNQDLRLRTQQHQQELQAAGQSLAEVTGFVQANSQSAETARDRAQVVNQTAERGLQAMRDLTVRMSGIASSSRKVGDIVGLIESIAFQTNLLALNAAVEAARAGEQGKGFAVVASEVRQLAGRSSAASRDIRALVQASAGEIQAGEQHAVIAQSAIDEMVTQVAEMSQRIGEIWETTFAQSSGINLLADTMRTLADNASSNVALVAQTTQLASELEHQAGELIGGVDTFRLPATAGQPVIA
ncbi:methyl-accepting chemotaxis protein [Ideonella sp. DXS22W]|uniref:Methyl-accepting chemotaxis protein n=1 Tax=Pseudaquabacterium inlustre TaxID=2984192 RepID=A0ABU9CF29_9BURK